MFFDGSHCSIFVEGYQREIPVSAEKSVINIIVFTILIACIVAREGFAFTGFIQAGLSKI